MKYTIEVWKLKKMLELLNEHKRVNLNPDYQRNPIWTLPVQKNLIDTILSGMPMPNFFIRKLPESKFEIVDGQQRCRTIMNFFNNIETTNGKEQFFRELAKEDQNAFLAYDISVVLLDEMVSDSAVRDFYVLVNSSGMKLNKAELRKAAYHNTNLLALCSKLASNQSFRNLKLFSIKSTDRMNDVDFVSELITYLIEKGASDKKLAVESAYKADIDLLKATDLEQSFLRILDTINRLNAIRPICDTRMCQKADFYTLFSFIYENEMLPFENLIRLYEVIISLDNDISPSQEECEPLKEYALACVSQSNSKKARDTRYNFFVNMFLNTNAKPTEDQIAVASFTKGKIVSLNGYTNVSVVR